MPHLFLYWDVFVTHLPYVPAMVVPPCLHSWSISCDICCYFSHSSKRIHQFQVYSRYYPESATQNLTLSQTRWLSTGKVISRILGQWDALVLFFEEEIKTDGVTLDGAREIYKIMVNRGTKHMLLFLKYVLGKVDKMNLEFQSEQYRLDTLHASIAG